MLYSGIMKPEVITRKFNINNFETIQLEGEGNHADPNLARLLAVQNLLIKVQLELTRIYNIRKQLNNSSEYDIVTWNQIALELQAVQQELMTYHKT